MIDHHDRDVGLHAPGEKIRDRLLERDFREELMGDTQPPAAYYFAFGPLSALTPENAQKTI